MKFATSFDRTWFRTWSSLSDHIYCSSTAEKLVTDTEQQLIT